MKRGKRVLGTAPKTTGKRDAKTVEANSKIMDDLLDKLRGAPKDSARHQRRRAARRNVSGASKTSLVRSVSASSEAGVPTAEDSLSLPTVAVVAPENTEDGGELDLGKVAQGLLAGLKGGDDLLASFREARKSVNAGMNVEESKPESPEPAESLVVVSTTKPEEG